MGLETHVVEFAPKLMAVQLDDGGAKLLRRKIEADADKPLAINPAARIPASSAASGTVNWPTDLPK